MTYRQIFNLKYKKGYSTGELMRRFPDEIERVSEVALLDIPEDTLREIVREEEKLKRLLSLRKRLGQHRQNGG